MKADDDFADELARGLAARLERHLQNGIGFSVADSEVEMFFHGGAVARQAGVEQRQRVSASGRSARRRADIFQRA